MIKHTENLPTGPGVYRFYDQTGSLLYVGKAINLKRRVSSYFGRPHDARLTKMVSLIDQIKIEPTGSAIVALFLESYLINTHQPPYNVRQKDDKTFILIAMSDEDFPRVILARPTALQSQRTLHQFGPYTSTQLVRQALQIIRKILPFRTRCVIKKDPNGRGCLDYQIGLCPGPCAGVISKKDYRKRLTQLVYLFEGKKRKVLTSLTTAMRQAAKKHNFEEAARIRNQLSALQHIQDVAILRKDYEKEPINSQELPQRIEGYDISNLGDKYAVASMVVIANGQPDKEEYRHFRIKTVVGQNDLLMMQEVLTRRLLHRDWPIPNLLVIDGGLEHLKIGKRVLKQLKLQIPLIAAAKGPTRTKLDLYPSEPDKLPLTPELVQSIRLARDEAHRFAIRYHRTRRTNEFLVN